MDNISCKKTLVVIGPPGAGKATLIGSLLFKYGAIEIPTMELFQKEGINTHDKAWRKLKSLHGFSEFDIPNHHVRVTDEKKEGDCVILVVAPGALHKENLDRDTLELVKNAKQLILLINKMDSVAWSKELFENTVQNVQTQITGCGINLENVPIIPVSALSGDNLIELSPKCSWYKGWVEKSSGKDGTTLLQALEVTFDNLL